MSVCIHPTLHDLVQLQYEARNFSLLPKQPVHSLLSGQHASRLRGRGITFEEMRRYRPGDDIRSIDWKATARLRKTHVRVFSEERDRPVLLVVDQRSNMFFGSQRATKSAAAAETASLAAWRAVDRGDRIGAIVFGDDEMRNIKPLNSKNNTLRICHEIVQLNDKLSASNQATNPDALNEALTHAVNVAYHDHLVILITDYHGHNEKTKQLTTKLAAHNDVLAVLVYDPLGIRLPNMGALQATDGAEKITIPSSSSFSDHFEEAFRLHSLQIRELLKAIRIPVLPICTHEPVTDQVLSALGSRR